MKLFKPLTPKQEAEFRKWARDNYKPFEPINGTWHPVVQDECVKMNTTASLPEAFSKALRKTGCVVSAILIAATIGTASADDRKPRHKREREPNWIIERQTTYQVQGVPTSRRIIGKREFDVYRTGEVFEKGNRVR